MEAETSEAQGHPWLHSKFKVSLGYIRPHLKGKKKKEKDGVAMLPLITSLVHQPSNLPVTDLVHFTMNIHLCKMKESPLSICDKHTEEGFIFH